MSEVVDVRYGGVPIAIVVSFVVPCSPIQRCPIKAVALISCRIWREGEEEVVMRSKVYRVEELIISFGWKIVGGAVCSVFHVFSKAPTVFGGGLFCIKSILSC